jgi:hypothetical protein
MWQRRSVLQGIRNERCDDDLDEVTTRGWGERNARKAKQTPPPDSTPSSSCALS